MAIIRITNKQLKDANKARDAALKKYPDFRLHAERQRLGQTAAIQSNGLRAPSSASPCGPGGETPASVANSTSRQRTL